MFYGAGPVACRCPSELRYKFLALNPSLPAPPAYILENFTDSQKTKVNLEKNLPQFSQAERTLFCTVELCETSKKVCSRQELEKIG